MKRMLFLSSLAFYLGLASPALAAEVSGTLSKRLVFRKVYGQIFCTEKKVKKPVKAAKIKIMDYDKAVAKTLTKADGKYEMNLKLKEGERYSMEVSTPCGQATKDFVVDPDQESNILNFGFLQE